MRLPHIHAKQTQFFSQQTKNSEKHYSNDKKMTELSFNIIAAEVLLLQPKFSSHTIVSKSTQELNTLKKSKLFLGLGVFKLQPVLHLCER